MGRLSEQGIEAFFELVEAKGQVKIAAELVGVTKQAVYQRAARSPEFHRRLEQSKRRGAGQLARREVAEVISRLRRINFDD